MTPRLALTALKIPKRIERGPTDILRALASTVKHMPSEPDTLLHDDPYLLPTKQREIAIFSLARISGKNTAKFLLNRHPELFYRDDAEPKIRAFNAPEEFRDDMEYNVDDLKWCIEHHDPINGIIAYKALVERDKVNLDNELLLQFFELICYSGEDEVLNIVELQKRFFVRESELTKYNWRANGLASKIFNQIKQDVSPIRVYSAMIAGLSKHNEHSTAKEVFEEFREFHADHGLCVEAYEYLLASVVNLNSSVVSAHKAIDDIVKHMAEHKVIPNLKVFNSMLDVYRRFDCNADVCQTAFQLLTDMRSLNIEPSLHSYTCLINIIIRAKEYPRYRNLMPTIFSYILNNDAALEIRDERDMNFLIDGANLFVGRLNDAILANKLYKVYLKQPVFRNAVTKRFFYEYYFGQEEKEEFKPSGDFKSVSLTINKFNTPDK